MLDSTIEQYLHRCLTWEKLTGKPMREVTAEDAKALKRDPNISPAYTKNLIVTLHSFHKFGAVEGFWDLNGIMLVGSPRRVEHNTEPPLHIDQARALLRACRRPLEYRLVYPGFYALTRIGESAALRATHWKWDRLCFRHEKSLLLAGIPIHPALQSVKPLILACSPSDRSGLRRAKAALISRVGFYFIAHQLRRTSASLLYDQEVPDEVVGKLLGHTGSVTRVYAPVSDDKQRRAIEMLPY